MITPAAKTCHVCGSNNDDGASHCRQCAVPAEIAAALPPFSDHLEADVPSVNRWDAAQLKTHPGTPWSLHLPAGEAKTITAKDINYIEVLDKNTSLLLWCSADQATLYVREMMQQNCADRWLTISGSVCRYGQLKPGDLLTIGCYPWVFHTYSRGQGCGLEPANPSTGATIRMHDVRVGRRLSIPNLQFASGSFVGIIGASGTGKSTLIREIVETRVGRGEVWIGGNRRDESPDPAAQRIAYVPQSDVIYDDMTVIQQTNDYVRLVHSKAKQCVIDESLRAVGLRNLVHRLPSKLSGGQVRRMRLAAALARRPGVLLLDEPDSGLDPETALSVRRLLRTISLLGTTVIIVTHHHFGKEQFDRTLTMDDGRIVADSQSEAIDDNPQLDDPPEIVSPTANSWKQFSQVFLRECVQFKQRKFFTMERPVSISLPQWLLVGALIPILFGLGIAIASPIKDFEPHLVGFLCVLSVIWMSASHSHLALTTNWYRTQYERWQGLRAYPLIAAKSVFLAIIATIQTCLFFAVLWATRYFYLERPMFYGSTREDEGLETIRLGQQHFAQMDQHVWGILLTLFVVGIAASQLGLLISVLAKWRTLVAASILPLVMIIQILFSPFVVQAKKSDAVPQETYAGFWWQQNCQGLLKCPSKLLVYRSDFGFTCNRCAETLESTNSTTTTLTESEIKDRMKENVDVPVALATTASYWTLTRHADLALRPIIASESQDEEYGYARLRRWGMISLIGIAVVCHGLVSLLFGCVSPQSILRQLRFLLMFYLFSVIGTASIHAEQSTDTIHVELPIDGDRYDAHPLACIGVGKNSNKEEPVWFPFTTKTRFALVVLKAEGSIADYSISPDRLVIDFNRGKTDEIQTVLFPPHFRNLKELEVQQQVVVLVHGLEGGAMTYRKLAPGFEDHGWFPLQLIYPNDGAVDKPAEFLRTELKRLHAKHPRTRFVIVAHSLGGLVAWEALANSGDESLGVTDMVTLGTPFGGSSLARFQTELEIADVAVRIMAGDWAGRDIDHDGSGEAIEMLLPESNMRRELLSRPLPESVRLHLVAGSSGPIAPSEQKKFADLIQRMIEKFQPRPEYAANLQQLAVARELITGAGDGAVTIESATFVKHFHSKHVFALSHLGLLLDRIPDKPNDRAISDEAVQRELLTWILSKLDHD